jgi:hypothetical protein
MTILKTNRLRLPALVALTFLVVSVASLESFAQRASITEPATVFYGKVLGLGSDQVFIVTEGSLEWTIRRADGTELHLESKLFPLLDGEFSYRLRVPHQALGFGLDDSAGGIPLRAADETQTHLRITINGQEAQILGPAGSTFDVRQAARAATYRLDLGVALTSVDSDGDGLPDWWKRKFGVGDPNGDPDGDGLNNLAEYRAGSDPTRDDRTPLLVTHEIRAFASSTSVLNLRAIDVDSTPEQLTYTIDSLPSSGAIHVRNAGTGEVGTDLPLSAGASFTQADVNQGRIVYVNSADSDSSSDSFKITLRDENSGHAPSGNPVQVFVYRPAPAISDSELAFARNSLPYQMADLPGRPAEDGPNINAYLLGHDLSFVISDGSLEISSQNLGVPSSGLSVTEYNEEYVPAHGKDRHHVVIGGIGADHLAGGMEDDVIIGGPGNDILRGNGGADLFVLATQHDGNDSIEDFSLAENDRIDLSRVLSGSSSQISDYLQVISFGADTLININFTGAGASSGYKDMVLTLVGLHLNASETEALLKDHLLTGSRDLPQSVSILATRSVAAENGPEAGAFTLTRSGSVESSLAVQLQISGTAQNGTDYELIKTEAVIPAGARSLQIPVIPYADSSAEPVESVDIAVLSGSGYELGTISSARVTIEDLAPLISIDVLEPLGLKTAQVPAALLFTRSGVVDRSVVVRLQIGGSAVNGVDYGRINSYINIPAGQTSEILEIVPSLNLDISQGPKTVEVTIKGDASYKVGAPLARVLLVDRVLNLAQWRKGYFNDLTDPLELFARQDPGNFGIPNLLRYAYGLDPVNPNPARLPRPVLRNGFLTIDIPRNPEATDIDVMLEVSRDLFNWEIAGGSIQPFVAPEVASDPTITSYRIMPGIKDGEKLFMKVRVIQKP